MNWRDRVRGLGIPRKCHFCREITLQWTSCDNCSVSWCARCPCERFFFDQDVFCDACLPVDRLWCIQCPKGQAFPRFGCHALNYNVWAVGRNTRPFPKRGLCCGCSGRAVVCFPCSRWRKRRTVLILFGLHSFRLSTVLARLPRDVLRYVLMPMVLL